MLEITRLTVEHLTADCVTDCPARISPLPSEVTATVHS